MVARRMRNHRHERFVQEYLVDLSPMHAAERAGYSLKTARQQGQALLKRPDIQDAIQAAMAERAKRVEVTADRVVQEYAKIAFLDPRAFYDAQGQLLPVHQLPEDVAAALSGMDVATERVGEDGEGKPLFSQVRKLRFSDKRGALDSLARHLGMFTERVEHSGTIEHKLQELSDADLDARIQQLLGKAGIGSFA